MSDLSYNEWSEFLVPSGTEVAVLSGATLEIPVNKPADPAENPLLIKGNGSSYQLMARFFGWDDPYYVHGSDFHPKQSITCGGATTHSTGGPGVYDVINSTVETPQGTTVSGVLRNAGVPTDPFLQDPVTGFTDQFGNTKHGYQFQRGSRDDGMGDTYGQQTVHFPQLQDNPRGAFSSDFEFFQGKAGDSEKGWSVSFWMAPQWFTGCRWNQSSLASCSGNGPGCDINWTLADGSNIKCENGSNPYGRYIYSPVCIGNTSNRQIHTRHKWEGSDTPCVLFASNSDLIYPDAKANPPGQWDQTYRTGLWTFWTIGYDGTQMASSDTGPSEAMYVAIGVPTGGSGPSESNFFVWSGDGSAAGVEDEQLDIDGGTLYQRGGLTDSSVISLASNYAFTLGAYLNNNAGSLSNKQAYWPGMISDFRIYSGQLPTGQARQIYLGSGIR